MKRFAFLLAALLTLSGCAASDRSDSDVSGSSVSLPDSPDALPVTLCCTDEGTLVELEAPDYLIERWKGVSSEPMEYWRYLYRKYVGAEEEPLHIRDGEELILRFGDAFPDTLRVFGDSETYASPGYVCGESPPAPFEMSWSTERLLDADGKEFTAISIPIRFSDDAPFYCVVECGWGEQSMIRYLMAVAP